MMSRKDYVAISDALRAARHVTPDGEQTTEAGAAFNSGLTVAARRIAEHFAADNPRFDNARFMAACGVQS
jgi:hypothetical protein